jgi:hypothetical protein
MDLYGSFLVSGALVEDGEWYELPEDFWEPVKRPQGTLEDTDTTRDLSGPLLVPGAFIEDGEWWEAPENTWGSVNRSPEFTESANATRNSSRLPLVPGAFVEDMEWREPPKDVPEPVKYSPGSSDDTNVVVAVMGVTGAGKSTFIKTVSGRNDVIVGDSLSSGLSESLQQYKNPKLT